MDENEKIGHVPGIADIYQQPARSILDHVLRKSRVRILVVVDGSISFTESPSGFGVGRVIRLLRESTIGCTKFTVDLARRDNSAPSTNQNPAPNQPRYVGFRFDQQENGQPIVNRYGEVWCFGFNPDNLGGPDTNITQATALPATDDELRVLATWMNDRQGGLLAMGDHDYLGASMCHRMARIRSMRRWTNAQGVPPIGGIGQSDTHLRHDTNQPATPDQINNGALIPFLVQEDATPQPVEWVPWISQRVGAFQIRKRPHPIFCHPTLGPINVFPDHPHEGWCFEDSEIDLAAKYTVLAPDAPEYPTKNGFQARPRVIAYGYTTPNPPFNLAKGPSPRKRFGLVSVYDGHSVDVGRVATDSTWHHWFDENIQAIEAAGGPNWEKIKRYFLNVAMWLAPPSGPSICLISEILLSHFSYLGFQEYGRKASVFELGLSIHAHLTRIYGPCWVTQWVFDRVRFVDRDLWAWLKDRIFWGEGGPVPGGDPCLSCPPFEWVEVAVLGGLVRAGFPFADRVRQQIAEKPGRDLDVDFDAVMKEQMEGIGAGAREFRSALAASIKAVSVLAR